MSDTVVVEGSEAPPAAPVVIVGDTGSGSGAVPDLAVIVGGLVERVEQLTVKVDELSFRQEIAPTTGDVIEIAASVAEEVADEIVADVVEVVADSEAETEAAAEVIAEETSEEVVADILEDESPTGKPWTHKSARELFGGKSR